MAAGLASAAPLALNAAGIDTETAKIATALQETVDELNALNQWFSETEKVQRDLQIQLRDLDRAVAKLSLDLSEGEAIARQQRQSIDATNEQITH